MTSVRAYAGGLKDIKIKIANGQIYDLFAAVSAESEPQMDEIEIKGDDKLIGKFISNIREDVTVSANGVSFDFLQAISGNNFASSPGGVEIPLGTDEDASPPAFEMWVDSQGRYDDNTNGTLRTIYHKCQVTSLKRSQAGEKEFNVEMEITAYKTDKDITGATLNPERVSTLKIFTS